MDQPAFNVGVTVGAIESARDAILKLMDAKADQKTIQRALATFKDVVSVNNVSLCNNNVDCRTINELKLQVVEPKSEAPAKKRK